MLFFNYKWSQVTPEQFAGVWGHQRKIGCRSPILDFFLKTATDFVQMPRYWLRVNGWLFQNVSNYIPNNSGWSQVTPDHFKSVLVKKTKSPGPFVVIIFILKTAPILVEMPPYGLRVNGWTLNMVSKSIEVQLQMVLGNSWTTFT